MTKNRELLKNISKAELHNHLHLGGSINMLQKRYPETRIKIPEVYRGLEGLIHFINKEVGTVMCNGDDYSYFLEMGILQAIADKIEYLEASIDLGMLRFFDENVDRLLDVVLALKNKYSGKIDFRPDLGINKDYPLEKVNKLGFTCLRSGLFSGIDIYGKEQGQVLNGFVKIYKEARKLGMKTKVHIGEFSDAQSIDNAIDLLQPTDIQHGIRAVDAVATMDKILNNNIRMNICPASNISLGASSSIALHPIRKLFDHGIKVTVNTDDHLLFNATITDQFMGLLNNGVFSLEEIFTIRENAFN